MSRAVFCLLLLVTMTASGTTLQVPSQYTTIQNAIDAANSFDTVLVAPGVYYDNIVIHGLNIVVTSSNGPEETFLQPSFVDSALVYIIGDVPKGMEFSGFTLKDCQTRAISIKGSTESSPTVKNNIITNNAYGIESRYTLGSVITGNVFHDNFGTGSGTAIMFYNDPNKFDTISYNLVYNHLGYSKIYISYNSDSIAVLNNTLVGGTHGFTFYTSGTFFFYNNIVTDITYRGIQSSVANIIGDYNIFYRAGVLDRYEFNTHDQNTDPMFYGTLTNNYIIQALSPARDAGNPVPDFNDPDGSRNDIGARPFDYKLPVPSYINVENNYNVVSHNPLIFWGFYTDGVASQVGFEFEVGTDNDWSVAEMLATGTVMLSDTMYVYDGNTLHDGITYYLRLRLYDGAQWGDWVETGFRMNTPPTTPVLTAPINGEYISVGNVNLSVRNAVDLNGDSVWYDFEIYNDIGMTQLVESITGVQEQPDTTFSGVISGLEHEMAYFWRSRAFDGFEYSSIWSDLQAFFTRRATSVTVPTDHPTIQAAIDAVNPYDTVLILPGTYTGTGNRDISFNGKNIILKGVAGATQTIIDCEGSEFDQHNGMIIENGEDSTLTIDGITIRNAYVNYWGAVKINNGAGATIQNCIFEDNYYYGVSVNYSWYSVFRMFNCQVLNNFSSGAHVSGNQYIENCFFVGNGGHGLSVDSWSAYIKNNSFINNGEYGLLIHGEPPKQSTNVSFVAYDSVYIRNNIAYNNEQHGMGQYFWLDRITSRCNISYPQEIVFYFDAPQENDMTINPLFCDPESGNYFLSSSSPALPENNVCGELIGASGLGCGDCCQGIRGNVDFDNLDLLDISDLLYLVDYFFADPSGLPPACTQEADVNNDSAIDISDLLFLVDYFFADPAGPPPVSCQ